VLLRSVPQTDPEHSQLPPALEGDVPSPARPPRGCHFHPRCPNCFEPCPERTPELYAGGDGRLSRCFLQDPSVPASMREAALVRGAEILERAQHTPGS
jgi:peptide/nickel transport system ATP-binding protein